MNEAGYFVALEGVTRYALTTAVTAILQNALGHAFFPSPPELRGQCDRAMAPYEAMRDRIRQRERSAFPASDAPRRTGPLTDAEKARGQALVDRLNKDFDGAKERAAEAERAEIRARYGMTPETLASIADQPFVGQRMGKNAA